MSVRGYVVKGHALCGRHGGCRSNVGTEQVLSQVDGDATERIGRAIQVGDLGVPGEAVRVGA